AFVPEPALEVVPWCRDGTRAFPTPCQRALCQVKGACPTGTEHLGMRLPYDGGSRPGPRGSLEREPPAVVVGALLATRLLEEPLEALEAQARGLGGPHGGAEAREEVAQVRVLG